VLTCSNAYASAGERPSPACSCARSSCPAGHSPAVVVGDEPKGDTGLKPAPGSLSSSCQNEYLRVVPEDLRLASVLETVLYYASDQQDDMKRFYENVLGLESLGLGRWSLAFRLGQGVVLLFDRERSSTQDKPPPHGASGSIHTAFLAAPGEYDAWQERLADRGVTLIDEIAWDSGVRSCYFNDPAGNLLEIAERDLWPE
jgi:catechol 2,3-dioxygenase-like lactoylglutathione lyase family enzyme